MTRLRRSLSVLFTALLLLSGGAPTAFGQGESATAAEIRQMLEQRDQEIKSILGETDDYTAEQRAQLKELVNGVIDFRVMGQRALGPHWEDLGEDQRDEFVSVFREVVRAQSMGDLGVYNSAVTYDQIDVQRDSAFVRTQTTYEGRTTAVEYVLERREDEWRAEDIIIDGVSTVEGYARSFQTVVRKRGFDSLMKSLRKKRDEVTDTSETGR
ncbi:MlaC/ttg2D family ABC transporter substrate-binding protein [Salinibacter ruber]|jgi:phospholipid transport system substrate-binding protein|uniref:MlaC/ttg2D family ABC transporter substrate-binding protein n=1 Tax=Salinibacter ruber TaxID=146919 RepID=UPI000E591055|nr:ABC transporter substrate-binding protein [Salinibacter ruber]MCS3627640.1 phospholipid transport system substrate-binding protein [Salinibacter ruber]MCS3633702.1 phospholipid transport system substrate-binding protein [Salinibacter ruber]MCS3664333.1 phospholipid transport system substrate-binding protein [Salinibacter ruber]MCS3703929.1 phospholipid transport system substrate-binding protein [Salinibacter ruber]MCS3712522.1 phospholipid transport system substrate-binding protein [Salinib